MEHILPTLSFKENALEPYLSRESIEYHYGKHHQTYVDNLNKLVLNSEFKGKNLDYVVRHAHGSIFNNAAQHWNHSFFWNCLSPVGGGEPSGDLAEAINQEWSSFILFKEAFQASAVSNFGSGWTWLVKAPDARLKIINTSNAETPLTTHDIPLLTVDVWEHAYYIDYRNARPKFLQAFWHVVNWKFVEKNFS